MRRYRASWPGSTACPARSERWVSRTGTLARDSAHPACRRAARAHSSVEEHSPYKRRVTGSNPVAPTRPEAIWCMAASRRGAKRGAKHVALASGRTLQAGAAGMAKMPSTSRRTRTGTSARSRSVSARTVSACAGRSLARPSKRSGTSSRPSTRSWTLACSLRRDTRSRRRWTRGSSTGCQAGRRGRSSCTDGALPAVGDLHRPGAPRVPPSEWTPARSRQITSVPGRATSHSANESDERSSRMSIGRRVAPPATRHTGLSDIRCGYPAQRPDTSSSSRIAVVISATPRMTLAAR
jgi:hypothetical protein